MHHVYNIIITSHLPISSPTLPVPVFFLSSFISLSFNIIYYNFFLPLLISPSIVPSSKVVSIAFPNNMSYPLSLPLACRSVLVSFIVFKTFSSHTLSVHFILLFLLHIYNSKASILSSDFPKAHVQHTYNRTFQT